MEMSQVYQKGNDEMKIEIIGTSNEIKKLLDTIGGSKEQLVNNGKTIKGIKKPI